MDLCDHQSTVHAVRFSPCGTMLASASDRLVTVYKGKIVSCSLISHCLCCLCRLIVSNVVDV